jgi:peroxiredoxin (alkyl hydroperoxide reductase subunit C)
VLIPVQKPILISKFNQIMKTKLLFLVLGLLFATEVFSQSNVIRVPLIGETAPSFTAESTNGTITFPDGYGRKWKVLCSHPADFTPVCSSEILEMASQQKEFDKLKTQLVVVSTDDLERHYNWKKSLETLNYDGKGQQEINFPIVDDHTKAVANLYGMIQPNSGSSKDVRGVFIIDPSNTIRALYFYPSTTGRNMDEIRRTIEALQKSDKETVLTPANWQPGEDVLIPYVASGGGVAENPEQDIHQLTWYMMYKKDK